MLPVMAVVLYGSDTIEENDNEVENWDDCEESGEHDGGGDKLSLGIITVDLTAPCAFLCLVYFRFGFSVPTDLIAGDDDNEGSSDFLNFFATWLLVKEFLLSMLLFSSSNDISK